MNSLTAAELKRRGMAAIEEGLRRGPIHLVKRNRPTAVVVSAEYYAKLTPGGARPRIGVTAMQWLLSQPAGTQHKIALDKARRAERKSWK